MDGTGRSVIVDTKITWPNGLTLDYVTERIYWADAREDYIEFASLDGSNRHVGQSAGELPTAAPTGLGWSVRDQDSGQEWARRGWPRPDDTLGQAGVRAWGWRTLAPPSWQETM